MPVVAVRSMLDITHYLSECNVILGSNREPRERFGFHNGDMMPSDRLARLHPRPRREGVTR